MKLRLKESPDFGSLVLRIGIGLMFVLVHGLPKVMGSVSMWAGLGGAFNRLLGVAFIPAFWGFLATLSAFGGAMCLMAGVLFRPACSLMFTLVIAVASIIRGGYGLNSASQPVELGFVLLSLIFTGPGRLTLPSLFTAKGPRGPSPEIYNLVHGLLDHVQRAWAPEEQGKGWPSDPNSCV